MALRNQPYIPLYVQDFLTDEKLNECSAQSTGVYIRLMCIMHKSDEYGAILLKQKDKQTDNQINNFALKIAKHMPYENAVIESSLLELIEEGVIRLEGDKIYQKRMVNDNELSNKRAIAGTKGGNSTQSKGKENGFDKAKSKATSKAKPQANCVANSEVESEDENEYDFAIKKEDTNTDIFIGRDFSDEIKEAVVDWLMYKKEKRQPYKPVGIKSLLTQINNKIYELGELGVIKAITESMACNYTGIIWDKAQQSKSTDTGFIGINF